MNSPEKTLVMPEWLLAEADKLALSVEHSKSLRELEQQNFTIAFETILEKMSEGVPFTTACNEYPALHTPITPGRFRTWIFRNSQRKNAYLVAKALAAEAVEDEMIRISDGMTNTGSQLPDEVPRSKLRIDTRKWLLTVWNRQRYGEVKQIEQKTTVDVSAMSTEELKRMILQQVGEDAEDAEFMETENDDDDA